LQTKKKDDYLACARKKEIAPGIRVAAAASGAQ
jgi:hypothetical protein